MLPPVETLELKVGDDETTGAWVGLFWLDTTGPTLYMVTDVTTGAAAWRVIADWS